MKQGVWILLALLLVSVSLNIGLLTREPETLTRVEHDTIWRDSIIREPLVRDSIVKRIVYVKVPHYLNGDTVNDSIEVPVPIVQKRYEDSLYTAWVSGFRPNLDSLRLHLPEITTTITKTITKPAPRLSVGIQTGAGFGIINRQADIYVGIGAQYNIFRK